jgi:hypothetical protein
MALGRTTPPILQWTYLSKTSTSDQRFSRTVKVKLGYGFTVALGQIKPLLRQNTYLSKPST